MSVIDITFYYYSTNRMIKGSFIVSIETISPVDGEVCAVISSLYSLSPTDYARIRWVSLS